MKTKIIPILIFILVSFLNNSCEDENFRIYKGYDPVYLTYDELRESVKVTEAQPLKDPGKIYFKDDYLFIIEELKGIHVYDNSDPSNPTQVSFIELPGVIDMSISGVHMYADSYVDLVVLSLADMDNIFEEGRIKDAIPYTLPPTDPDYPIGPVDIEKGVVTGWELKTIKERWDYHPIIYPIYFTEVNDGFLRYNTTTGGGISGSGVGVGGSMARFGIKGDALYIVDQNSITIFDIGTPAAPVKHDQVYAGWNIETMFLTNDYMFLGTTTGMLVFDTNIPFLPQKVSDFRHARSCDPVIVDDNTAFVTLRSGTTCGGDVNSLDVIDITNINDPELIMSYPLFNPHGLGKDGNTLFICDGSQGLKIYNTDDLLNITDNLIYSYPSIDAFDVIPLGNVLVLIGDDGLYQYDYSSLDNISLLSKIGIMLP